MLNSDMQKLLLSFKQLHQRPQMRFLGSLLLIFVGVLLALYIFGELAEEVWENENGFSFDVPILLAVHQAAQPQLDTIAIFLTRLGVFWGVFPIATAVTILLILKRHWNQLIYFLSVLLGSMIINWIVKLLLHRTRPHLWQSPAPEFDYGFPSGHAMSSMTLVAALVILTWKTRWRWWVVIPGSVYVLVIAWTRLYLGVHYPSDILAGWVVSIAWAIGMSLLIKPNATKYYSCR
jgi:membrane-associated phospholipid phosphatase